MSHSTIHKRQRSGYLYADKALRLSRTLYKSALFMQNKPNFLNPQTNVTSILTVDCENIAHCTLCENKPNPSPIKLNLRVAQINLSHVNISCYENPRPRAPRENKPNLNPRTPFTLLPEVKSSAKSRSIGSAPGHPSRAPCPPPPATGSQPKLPIFNPAVPLFRVCPTARRPAASLLFHP